MKEEREREAEKYLKEEREKAEKRRKEEIERREKWWREEEEKRLKKEKWDMLLPVLWVTTLAIVCASYSES
jgi:hypothetical protein